MTYLLGFLLALAESALGIGALLPGELALTGLATSLDTMPMRGTLVMAVALGASGGDHVGYLLGRHSGPRLRVTRLVARVGTDRWDRATELVARHGAAAILLSRMLPLVRTVMPAVAGAVRLPYRRFLPASIIGAVLWSTLWVAAGTTLAASGILNDLGLIAAGLATVAGATVATRLARRAYTRRHATT